MAEVVVFSLAVASIYGLIATGIVLVYKSSGILNFAQAEVGALALYFTLTFQDRGLPWAIAALLAIAIAAAIGIVFDALVLRRLRGAVTLSVATAGLLLLIFAVEIVGFGPAPQIVKQPIEGAGIALGSTGLNPMQIIALVVLAAVASGLALLINRTRLGLGLLAVASNTDVARLMGVPYAKVSGFAWGAAGALGALAGVLIGPQLGAFSPLSMTAALFMPGLTAALVGGLASLPGAFVGALIVGFTEIGLKTVFPTTPGADRYGLLVLVMVVLLWRPSGLLCRSNS